MLVSDRLLEQVFGARRAGSLAYRRNPALGRAWGGPMNGQKWRCLMVAELIQTLEPIAIVETGTYLGTTTDWLNAFKIPLYSCEASLRNFGFSQARLLGNPDIHLIHADSRAAIKQVLAGPLRDLLDQTILFYLDAHWNDDLPLADEIKLIFDKCPGAVALIDDFQVPGDEGYAYDDYGHGRALVAEYVAPSVAHFGLGLHYPTTPSSHETGARRGCAVLSGPLATAKMKSVKLLGPA